MLLVSKNLSWYLDLIRLLAAVAVLIGHAHGYILPVVPVFIASHAEEAVSGFFVLSGFVIMYVLTEKEKDWKSYATARFLRLYSVVPIALVSTYVLDQAGTLINSQYYENIPFYDPRHIENLLSSVTFTNEFWFNHTVFGSNEAYWSLGFEVPYYIAIGLLIFLPSRIALIGTALWLFCAGPKILLALPLWVLGALTYQVARSSNYTMTRRGAAVTFLSSIALYVFVKLSFSDYKEPLFHLVDLQESLMSLLYYLGVSSAFALNIFAFSRLDRAFQIPVPGLIKEIRWLAGGSFTLYLVHQPLLAFVAAVLPDVKSSALLGFVSLIVVVIACYLIAELGERRKRSYERPLRWILQRVFPRSRSKRVGEG